MKAAKRRLLYVVAILLLQPATPLWANGVSSYTPAPVTVVGLFKDRALLRVAGSAPGAPAGQDVLVRVGETKDGITLLAANAQQARVRYQGETYRLSLTRGMRATYAAYKRKRVAVRPDYQGQYRVQGSINEAGVDFLVDTGASVVALSSQQAERLGINYRAGRLGRVHTAQGETNSYFVELPEVSVGDITVRNVRTAIIDGAYPRTVLLGMSFLSNVQMREDSGVLMLTQK